jgi:hypothetical protein
MILNATELARRVVELERRLESRGPDHEDFLVRVGTAEANMIVVAASLSKRKHIRTTADSDLSAVGYGTIEGRLKLRGNFGALLLVRFFTDFTAKLMVKVSSAN